MAKKKDSTPVKPIWTIHLFEDSYTIEEIKDPQGICLTDVLYAVIEDLDAKADRDDSNDLFFSE